MSDDPETWKDYTTKWFSIKWETPQNKQTNKQKKVVYMNKGIGKAEKVEGVGLRYARIDGDSGKVPQVAALEEKLFSFRLFPFHITFMAFSSRVIPHLLFNGRHIKNPSVRIAECKLGFSFYYFTFFLYKFSFLSSLPLPSFLSLSPHEKRYLVGEFFRKRRVSKSIWIGTSEISFLKDVFAGVQKTLLQKAFGSYHQSKVFKTMAVLMNFTSVFTVKTFFFFSVIYNLKGIDWVCKNGFGFSTNIFTSSIE